MTPGTVADTAALLQGGGYVADAARGDFGKSYRTNIPVFREIATRVPYTLCLAVISTFR